MPIVKGCSTEILADIVLDKIVGQIPVIGIGANMICAKAMTWRLGILFAMISARGEEISVDSVRNTARMIREVFPQKSSVMFKKPSAVIVEKLINQVEGVTVEDFDTKVERIIDALQ